jgi:hypothetical protein
MRPHLRSADGGDGFAIRRLVLAVFVLGLLGTAADLLLIDHYEDAWQLPPLVLIGVALGMVAWVAASGARGAVLALRGTLLLFIVAGAAGIVLHFTGNAEFQREIDPSLSGWPLFLKVIRAKAPPALAPASLVHLGLLGLAYTYKHPALTIGSRRVGSSSMEEQS